MADKYFALPVTLTLFLGGCSEEEAKSRNPSSDDDSPVSWVSPEWKEIAANLESAPLSVREQGIGLLFKKRDGATLGLDFQNLLKRENIKNYLLAGAGLAVGDIDGNGLPDVFLVSQDGPNKLFKQSSPWVFQDVTTASGIRDLGTWGSGAAFADFENDGDLDLYVCNKGAYDEVYLNQGDGTFRGNTIGTGNASLRAPTMVAFADYDLDGDLDFYQTSTRLLGLKEMFGNKLDLVRDEQGAWQAHPKYGGEFEVIDGIPRELGTEDILFRNEGSSVEQPFRFREVTTRAGIKASRDHGLAAVWWDFDNDDYPDLYVSNDFHTPDRLYRNNRDGTFREVTGEALAYTSWSSMGSDFADVNNDGWFDYLSTDMSATTHFKQKTMMGAMTDTAWFLDNLEPRQYMRNALHVNTQTGQFLETAFYSGLDSTDWTWSGVFGDLNNDGLEDAFFTNGIERNVQDSDMNLRMNAARDQGATNKELTEMFLNSPRFKEQNLAFRNDGKLRFSDQSKGWGLDDLSVSHGAVLCDLDRDGDLDVLVNNMNDPVGVFENRSGESDHAILVSLRGRKNNRFGLGARITAWMPDGTSLTRIITSSRGYMSGCEPVAHLGLGPHESIKKLEIRWPGGGRQTFADLASDFHYRITESTDLSKVSNPVKASPLFTDATSKALPDFRHEENIFNDFNDQPLLPNRLSRHGPALAIADLNGDGRPDYFLGGACGHDARLFLQKADGSFKPGEVVLPLADADYEDIDAVFFDADQDGDQDLFVVSGGASHEAGTARYHDRLYLNDGTGRLQPAPAGSLPPLAISGSCVAPCDFDGDGDTDLFVGGRHVPGQYPTVPESALLVNEGRRFTRAGTPFDRAGMVTDAIWADLDGDQRPDLVLATEWGPLKIFLNKANVFVESTKEAGLENFKGWWTCVEAVDLDGDGDQDLVAGNFGLNTKYYVDDAHPATLFASDFGDQGRMQLVEAKLKDGKLLPVRGRSCSTTAMPHLKKLAPTYTDFALKSLPELYTPQALDSAMRLEANSLASAIFRNSGSGTFTHEPLPVLSQLAPVMSIATGDFNGDGRTDLALGQNFFDPQRETGRMNGGLGVVVMFPDGMARELSASESGFVQRTNLRHLHAADFNLDGRPDLISANNDQAPKLFLSRREKPD